MNPTLMQKWLSLDSLLFLGSISLRGELCYLWSWFELKSHSYLQLFTEITFLDHVLWLGFSYFSYWCEIEVLGKNAVRLANIKWIIERKILIRSYNMKILKSLKKWKRCKTAGWRDLTYNNRFDEAFGEGENHFALQKHLMVSYLKKIKTHWLFSSYICTGWCVLIQKLWKNSVQLK